jgi:ATP-dependent DNA helicase RecG
MIEAWGRGVEKVIDACRKSGLKEPDFRYEKTGLWVEFVFSIQETESTAQETEESTQENEKTTQENEETTQEIEATTQENEISTQETTQQKILLSIQDKPDITRRELAEKVGISSNGVKYHLDKLKNRGVIRHVGATKKGYWEILIVPDNKREPRR